jgi:predicted DNA binding CopG/RHH family protein
MGLKRQEYKSAKEEKPGKQKTIRVYIMSMYLDKIKAKAKKEGIYYKTLMSNVLHKYANNQLRQG